MTVCRVGVGMVQHYEYQQVVGPVAEVNVPATCQSLDGQGWEMCGLLGVPLGVTPVNGRGAQMLGQQQVIPGVLLLFRRPRLVETVATITEVAGV